MTRRFLSVSIKSYNLFLSFIVIFSSAFFSACNAERFSSEDETLASELVLYNWEGDIPPSVLDAFTEEYGVKIGYLVYESQEEGIDQLRLGQHVDVMVMDSGFIPQLIKEGLVSRLDHRHLGNFKNISPNFRGLSYDPGNEYSIPYSWGATALVVRSDLVSEQPSNWTDLWNPALSGKVGLWIELQREVISIGLKSLGFSANSENPEEINAAINKLIELKPRIKYLEDFDLASSSEVMASGEIVLSMGYAVDVAEGQKLNSNIELIYPKDGALLWGDTFIIPVTTHSQYTAEVFINFLMRPEVAAEIVNYNSYASANETAMDLLDPAILVDPLVYPPLEDLTNSELLLPLSEQGQALYDQAWEQFLMAPPETIR